MKCKYFLLILTIIFSITVDAQPQNELGFGGGYFKPYTTLPNNIFYKPRSGVGAYIIYDRNFNRGQHRFYPSLGMRTQMFLFREEANLNAIIYDKPVRNFFWPIIALPLGLNCRLLLHKDNLIRLGVAAGPYGTIFPAHDAKPELGWQTEACLGYGFKQTTLSLRVIQPMQPYAAEHNKYIGTAIALDAKFDVAKRAPTRDVLIKNLKKGKEVTGDVRKHGAVPAVEMSLGYGKFIPYNMSPAKHNRYLPDGNISMLNVDCYFDKRGKGLSLSFGANGSYMWTNDMQLYSVGGKLGGIYQLPITPKLRLRTGISMGPSLVLHRKHTKTPGWWQGDMFADVLLNKRISVGVKYCQPFNRIELNDYEYENQYYDRMFFNVRSIMLECKVRLSQSR